MVQVTDNSDIYRLPELHARLNEMMTNNVTPMALEVLRLQIPLMQHRFNWLG